MHRRLFLQRSAQFVAALGLLSLCDLEFLRLASASTGIDYIGLAAFLERNCPGEVNLVFPRTVEAEGIAPAFNLRTALEPAIRALCLTPHGVACVVRWLAEQRINGQEVPFAISGGRHSYEGLSQTRGLSIDLRCLDAGAIVARENVPAEFRTQAADAILEAEAGILLGKVYAIAHEAGYLFPAGTCSSVGLTGHLTGGGIGMLTNAYGLACDNLLGAEMVLLNGDRVMLSEKSYPDLFWAIRGGGGGTFGVITRLWLRLHRSPTVTYFLQRWLTPDPAVVAGIFARWQRWRELAPRNLSHTLNVVRDPTGVFKVNFLGQIPGDCPELEAALAQVRGDVTPAKEKVRRAPAAYAAHYFNGDSLPPHYFKGTSAFLKSVVDEANGEQIFSRLAADVYLVFFSLGGAFSQIANGDTAFGYRDRPVALEISKEWGREPSPEGESLATKDVADTRAAFEPFAGPERYINFCDGIGSNFGPSYWGPNFPALQVIKKKYDSKNIFHHAQSVEA